MRRRLTPVRDIFPRRLFAFFFAIQVEFLIPRIPLNIRADRKLTAATGRTAALSLPPSKKYRTKSTPYVAHLVNANVRRKRLRSSPWQRQSRERQKRPLPLRTAKQRLPGLADCDPEATDAVPEPGSPRQPKVASLSRRGRWGKVYTFDGRYYSLAPAWRSMSASSGRLYFRAIDSAVLPSRVFAFTLAPAASSARVTSMRPA